MAPYYIGRPYKLSELVCAVLCTTAVHNDMHTQQFSMMSVGKV